MSSFYDEIKKLMVEEKKEVVPTRKRPTIIKREILSEEKEETIPTQKNPKIIKTEVLSAEQKEVHMKLFDTLPKVTSFKALDSIERTTATDILSLDEAKQFLRIAEEDETEDDYISKIVIPSAVAYVCNYTGLTIGKVTAKEDLKSAILIVCGIMFDNRGAMVSSQIKMNPMLSSILDMHSVNLL